MKYEALSWDPVIGNFRGISATLEHVITFRLILEPSPNRTWGNKFRKDYPELPLGVDTWFRTDGIVEVVCPLDLLTNTKRRLQTHVNEVNIWFEKSVLPPYAERERASIEEAKTLAQIVDRANEILEDKYVFEDL